MGPVSRLQFSRLPSRSAASHSGRAMGAAAEDDVEVQFGIGLVIDPTQEGRKASIPDLSEIKSCGYRPASSPRATWPASGRF